MEVYAPRPTVTAEKATMRLQRVNPDGSYVEVFPGDYLVVIAGRAYAVPSLLFEVLFQVAL